MRCFLSRGRPNHRMRFLASVRDICRTVSTAPPLSLLSWSVDGTCHTHHRYRRRLSLEQRIPILRDTILAASPDVVALQDSVPEIAEALCGPSSSPSYDLIGAARNGRCGFLQLFQRHDSLWRGHTLPHFPSLTAEFVHTADNYNNNNNTNNNNNNNDNNNSMAACGTRFVLTNVDLTYRGKSLAIGGTLLAPQEVSTNGSPFTLTVPGSDASPAHGREPRVKGQLDPHRDAALAFISSVARPDVLVGNFYMGRAESMPGYSDAWVLAGAPADHERTTNTFAHHKHDAETNGCYFLPLSEAGDENSMCGGLEISPSAPVGTPIPLHAVSRGPGAGWGTTAVSLKPLANSDNNNNNNNNNNNKSRSGSVAATPEGAGRYQRCLFRRKASRHHRPQLSFCQRYERTQFVVLRPFVEVKRTVEEWALRGGGSNGSGTEGSVRCSASDQYPILVLLS